MIGNCNTTSEARAARPPREFSYFTWTEANADLGDPWFDASAIRAQEI